MDHQPLMIHCRKLVVRPINVSDWIFDIWANPFVRHLIKVLKGSAAIAGQSCPQSGLNRVLSSLRARCPLLPHLLPSLLSHFHPSLLCKCGTPSGLPWWEGQPGPAGEGLPSPGCLPQRLRPSGAGLGSQPSAACPRPSSWAVSRHPSRVEAIPLPESQGVQSGPLDRLGSHLCSDPPGLGDPGK